MTCKLQVHLSLLMPASLSIFVPGDLTPVLVGSKQAGENVFEEEGGCMPIAERLHININNAVA